MHPFDQPEVIAGQGTLGIEIEEQVPDVDTVLMGVGGGGPLAGIAAWCGDRVRVVGVEPEGCASMTAALAAGEPVVGPGGRARVGLARRRPGRRPHVPDRPRSRGAHGPRHGGPDPGRATGPVGGRPVDRRAGRRRRVRGAPVRRLSRRRPGSASASCSPARNCDPATITGLSSAGHAQAVSASSSSRSFVVVFQFRIVICW